MALGEYFFHAKSKVFYLFREDKNFFFLNFTVKIHAENFH